MEMAIKTQIDQDIKQAMLAGDKTLVTTLRGLKSAILYAEVAAGTRDKGLSDEETMAVLGKEAKKRQESADMYRQGGSEDRAIAEETERAVIEKYLPAQMDDQALEDLVSSVIAELGASGPQAMGAVIGEVKKRSNGQADGGRIAKLAKEKLQ